jgi:hypothetical protein
MASTFLAKENLTLRQLKVHTIGRKWSRRSHRLGVGEELVPFRQTVLPALREWKNQLPAHPA